MPTEKKIKDIVIGATINQDGILYVKTTKIGSDTFLAHIINLVEEAQGTKVPIQKVADKVTNISSNVVVATINESKKNCERGDISMEWETKAKELEGQVVSLKSDFDKAKSDLDAKVSEIQSLSEIVTKKDLDIADLKNQIAEKDVVIKDQKTKIDEFDVRFAEIEKKEISDIRYAEIVAISDPKSENVDEEKSRLSNLTDAEYVQEKEKAYQRKIKELEESVKTEPQKTKEEKAATIAAAAIVDSKKPEKVEQIATASKKEDGITTYREHAKSALDILRGKTSK